MSKYVSIERNGERYSGIHVKLVEYIEKLEKDKQDLKEQVEKLTLPRLAGTPIDQPHADQLGQVISHLKFWQEHPAEIRAFTTEELQRFFQKQVQALEEEERRRVPTVVINDPGTAVESARGILADLIYYQGKVGQNPANALPVWQDFSVSAREKLQELADESEAESRRQSAEEKRELVSADTEPKGKEVVRLPQPHQQQLQPVRLPTPKPSAAATPAADEDVEIIDVVQEPLGGIGKRKPADEPYHEDDTRERKERPALPTVREAYAATRHSDVTPADERLLREVTRDSPSHATVTRRLGVRIPDSDFEPEDSGAVGPHDLEHEEIHSDTETITGDSLDAQIHRQQRKKISVWKKLGPRKPNKKEEEKLAGYDTEVRRLRILKAQAAGVPSEKIPVVLYLWGQQDRERISRKEKQQLRDLLE